MQAIYSITHIATGRCYIGSAVNTVSRWAVHRSKLSRGKHHCVPLQRAWRKYGADQFVFAVVEPVPAVGTLLDREQYYLNELWKLPAAKRYNICPDATSTRGRPVSAATREKIARGLRGRPMAPDHGSRAYHGVGGYVPVETRERVRQLRREGETFPAIASVTGVSRFTARRICSDITLAEDQVRVIRARRRVTDEEVATAGYLHTELGWTHKAIARVFGVHRYTVSRWLT